MSYGRSKTDNEYARIVFDVDAPKTVWMAIAVSLMARLNDENWKEIPERIAAEWRTLHANGIVPQKPRGFAAGKVDDAPEAI